MFTQFNILYGILDKRMRLKLISSFPIFLIFAALETLGVAAVYPLLSYISTPRGLEQTLIVQNILMILQYFGVHQDHHVVSMLTAFTIFIILLSAVFRIFAYYYINIIVEYLRYQLSIRMMKLYCNADYVNIMSTKSNDIIKNLNHDVDYLVQQVIKNIIMAIPQIFIITGITAILVYLYPVVTFIVVFSLAFLYLFIYLIFNQYVSTLGQRFNNSVLIKNKIIFDYITNIKLIKAYRKDSMFETMYVNTMSDNTDITAKYNSFVQMPVYLFEAIILGISLTGLGILHIFSENGLVTVIPILGLFLMGIQKVKPGFQMAFRIFTDVRNNTVLINTIAHRLSNPPDTTKNETKTFPVQRVNEKICTLDLQDVGFKSDQDKWILRNFNYQFRSGEQYCIIGQSGSGKTTLADIILQILTPSEGQIFTNGRLVDRLSCDFDQTFARYVPQDTHLLSGTIAQNVAFTLEDEIDYGKVKEALRLAVLDETFNIENALDWADQDYTGTVSKLSGGQIQRIGIARALYEDRCSILILDEATSALDEQTEKELISRLQNTYIDKIVIHISHKNSIIQSCHNIIDMDDYKLKCV
jgi:ATP-binding cassette, subfamily B, bacterial PglK